MSDTSSESNSHVHILLRQHFLDGHIESRPLYIIPQDVSSAFGIHLHQIGNGVCERDTGFDLVRMTQREDSTGAMRAPSAVIHLLHGSICIEALSATVFVQTWPYTASVPCPDQSGQVDKDNQHVIAACGFDGSRNGWMKLVTSRPHTIRVLSQLQPGGTVYVGPLCLSFVVAQIAAGVDGKFASETNSRRADVTGVIDWAASKTKGGQYQQMTTIDRRYNELRPMGGKQVRPPSPRHDMYNAGIERRRTEVRNTSESTQSSPTHDSQPYTTHERETADLDLVNWGNAQREDEGKRTSTSNIGEQFQQIVKSPPSTENILNTNRATQSTLLAVALPDYRIFRPYNIVRKVAFVTSSAISRSGNFLAFLEEQGIEIVNDARECTILCVNQGGLKKTRKTLTAILFGKPIILDSWVAASAHAGQLLDHRDFTLQDFARELEWGISLQDALARGRGGARPFASWSVQFSSIAREEAGKPGFEDLRDLALLAGAKRVFCIKTRKIPPKGSQTLCIAGPHEAQAPGLWTTFHRNIIVMSILRGSVDIKSDEFMLQRTCEKDQGSDQPEKRRRL